MPRYRPPKKQNSRNGDGHAGALRIFEVALNENDTSENFHLVKRKLQHRFGLLPATAAVTTAATTARLAYAVVS